MTCLCKNAFENFVGHASLIQGVLQESGCIFSKFKKTISWCAKLADLYVPKNSHSVMIWRVMPRMVYHTSSSSRTRTGTRMATAG